MINFKHDSVRFEAGQIKSKDRYFFLFVLCMCLRKDVRYT